MPAHTLTRRGGAAVASAAHSHSLSACAVGLLLQERAGRCTKTGITTPRLHQKHGKVKTRSPDDNLKDPEKREKSDI